MNCTKCYYVLASHPSILLFALKRQAGRQTLSWDEGEKGILEGEGYKEAKFLK